jgi:nicotinamide-nucleotide amidase
VQRRRVPRELKNLLKQHILKILADRYKLPQVYIKVLRTTSIPEAKLYEKLEKTVNKYPKFELGFYPRYFGVDIRFRVQTEDALLLNSFENYYNEVKNIVSKYVYSSRQIELEEKIGELLKERSYTISTAESFTGGLISDLLTNIPGSSSYYIGSTITYSNQSKIEQLGVKEDTLIKDGAVSEDTALEMVRGVQKKFKTTCALSTTGIAGPDGGSDEKPVGLGYIAVRINNKEMVRKFNFGTERALNKLRGAVAAMEMLRRMLLNIE